MGLVAKWNVLGGKAKKKNVFYDYEHEDLFLD